MASSSRKFASGVGFSNGMGRVDVEEPAAVGAELLDGDLGRGRADREHLLGQGRLLRLGLALFVEDGLAVWHR